MTLMTHRRVLAWCLSALRIALSREVVARSLKISLVVGAALNVINQWDSLMAGTGLRIGSLMLNYLVPYCVASYSAVRTLMSQAREVVAGVDGAHCDQSEARPQAVDTTLRSTPDE
jgi:hypothetical protein